MKQFIGLLTLITLIFIPTVLYAQDEPTTSEEPTFAGEVANIIYEKCSICHRPGSSAPFSLLSYHDVARRSATIQAVIDQGYMPPWKPLDHGIAFANTRRLSDEQQQILSEWIALGCPEGDGRQTPAPPTFHDGWSLGTPDLVVRMNGEFQVPADGPDIYRSFVFPLDLPEDKWVKAVELRPTARSAVHHAIFFLDPTGAARAIDGVDGDAGIEGMGFLTNVGGDVATRPSNGANDRVNSNPLLNRLRGNTDSRADNQIQSVNQQLNRGLGGYVPGATPNRLPGDLAMPLPSGSDIVMQTHFHPSGRLETEQAELALYFADGPPSRPIVPIMIPPMFGFGANIDIPAGDDNFRIVDEFKLPIDTQAIGVSGHAHYLCESMKLTAHLPDGEDKILLEIDDWDLDWQDQYLFETPIDLPAATILSAELHYDNSEDNPENPHSPPQATGWGRGSTDEMGSLTLMTIANRENQTSSLQTAVQQFFIESIIDRDDDQLVNMMMQLDDDDDGKLQRSEAPPRLGQQAFDLIDTNNDGGLDASEFARVIRLRSLQRRGRN